MGLIKLIKAQTIYISKFTNIIIVYKDQTLIFIAFELVLQDFTSFNNSSKFIVIGFILKFS